MEKFEKFAIKEIGKKDFEGINLIELEKVEDLFPSLNRYDDESFDKLSDCVVQFNCRTNDKTGKSTYSATCVIRPSFSEEFKMDMFNTKNKSIYQLDEITYDLVTSLKKIPADKFNNFKAKCKYRISLGRTAQGRNYLYLEVACARDNDGRLVLLSKIIPFRRFTQFKLHKDWFETSSNPIVIYDRGSKDTLVVDDDEVEEDLY